MAKITKTEEQLTKDLETAMRKLYKTLEGTSEQKVQILRDKFENGIKQIQLTPKTKKIRKRSEPSEEMKAIIALLRQLRPQIEIASEYGKSNATISLIAKKNGIYSQRAVIKYFRRGKYV